MVNVFSFCLYGPENPMYYPGMLDNVKLVERNFPGWKVYVYYAPDVAETMVRSLAAAPNVVLRPTGILGERNMIQRFFAIDEPEVDVMLVRDADSRIHWKDRWAIKEFLASPYSAHTIRDHRDHTALLMGGLWGLKKSAGIQVRTEYEGYKEDLSLGHRLAHDQNFLGDVIYSKVRPNLLVHYSNNRWLDGEFATEFPFPWTEDMFCGRREYGHVNVPPPVGVFALPRVPIQFLNRK